MPKVTRAVGRVDSIELGGKQPNLSSERIRVSVPSGASRWASTARSRSLRLVRSSLPFWVATTPAGAPVGRIRASLYKAGCFEVVQKDAFMHNIAALRALVIPPGSRGSSCPTRGCSSTGRVVRDRAVVVDPHRVVTASGEEISADYIVLATGSRYPFPANRDLVDTHHAQEQVRRTPWLLRKVADCDPKQVRQSLLRVIALADLMQIVPSHDRDAYDGIPALPVRLTSVPTNEATDQPH